MIVTVLEINHSHGHDIWVCSSNRVAWKRLYGYVKEWWDRELPETDMPTDEQAAVDLYFDNLNGREDYTWTETEIDYGA